MRPKASTIASLSPDFAFALAVAIVGAVGVFSACRGSERTPATHVDAPEVGSGAAASADSTARPAANPLGAMAPERLEFAAVVAETIPAGGYTYVRLTAEDGEHWLATMGDGPGLGVRVVVHAYGSREQFHSRRTGKTFEHLLFGEVQPEA